ncbi:MAG: hypothetical protein JW734_01675, partial [Candidatus Omnitrophica bacterium]|nr:hypothetical protein [Candidatus Omnitrophota bacterium]
MLLRSSFKNVRFFFTFFIVLVFFEFIFLQTDAFSSPPRVITCHGRLTNQEEEILSGAHTFTFRLYSQQQGGSALWSETQPLSVGSSGLFSAYLGDTSAFPTALDFNTTYWISIEVDGDGEMSPRLKLPSAAYALNSYRLEGFKSSQFLRSDADDTMEGSLTFSGTAVDMAAAAGEDLVVNAGGATRMVNIASGNFKLGGATPTQALDGGDAFISGTLEVDGDAYMDGVLHVNGGLGITGNYVIDGYLEVNYTGTAHDGTSINFTPSSSTANDALEVTAGANTQGVGLKVTQLGGGDVLSLSKGATEILNVNNDVAVLSGDLTVGDALPTQALGGESMFVEGTFEVDGISYLDNLLMVGAGTPDIVAGPGDAYLADDFEVDGNADFGGNVNIAGNLSVGTFGFTDLDISGNLGVGGDTILGAASGDTLTFNASNLSIPNGLNISGGDMALTGGDMTVDTDTFFVDSASNRVGIGTTAPSVGLEVDASALISGNLRMSSNSEYISFGPSGAALGELRWLVDGISLRETIPGASGRYLRFYLDFDNQTNAESFDIWHRQQGVGPRAVFVIEPDGASPYLYSALDVGIGTTSPSYALDVQGNMGVTGQTTLNTVSYSWPGAPGNINQVLTAVDAAGTLGWADASGTTDSDWVISGNNIYSGAVGNVGIGTTNPQAKLEIATGNLLLGSGVGVNAILDEDGMNSNLDTALATQQSIKKYVDDSIVAAGGGDFMANGSVAMTGDLDVGDNNIVNVADIA